MTDSPKDKIVEGLIEVYDNNSLSERDECSMLNALEFLGFDIEFL